MSSKPSSACRSRILTAGLRTTSAPMPTSRIGSMRRTGSPTPFSKAAAPQLVQGAHDRALRLRALRPAREKGRDLFLHPQQRTSKPVGAVRPRRRERRAAAADRSQRLVADGATALAEWTPSEDGKLLAYSVQDGGTDWRTVKLMDVATGKIMGDELKWLKYGGNVAWAKDGSGFFYSRYPAPAAGKTYQNATLDHRVYFHKLGTAQAADRLIYAPRPTRSSAIMPGQRRWPLAGHLHQPGRRRERRSRVRLRKPGVEADRVVHRPQEPMELCRQRGQPLLFLDRQGRAAEAGGCGGRNPPDCAGHGDLPEAKKRSTESTSSAAS